MEFINKIFIAAIAFILYSTKTEAQEIWPKNITTSDGSTVKVFQPQPESFVGNTLKFRTPFSFQTTSDGEPSFGTFWGIATVQTNRDSRNIEITSVRIPNLKLPADSDATHLQYLKTTLETSIPASNFIFPLDYVISSLENYTEEKKISQQLNNQSPKIIYATKPSILVQIDGSPKLQMNNEWGLQAVVNSPFTIVNYNKQFYLYGNKQWYVSAVVTGNYKLVRDLPAALNKVVATINSNISADDAGYTSSTDIAPKTNEPVDIIVSTTPAELLQTNGEPQLTTIEGTNLMYVKNTGNDLFIDNTTKQYYVLLSGRWYTSSYLNQNWQYVEANTLPKDFSAIPEGNVKDNVLASIPGTDAAREAVIDAQIPQIAKVDRDNASATVTYDGTPQFNNIEGTTMEYGINTTSSVIKYRNTFYCVENGVWFQSLNATGPWQVCTQRPEEIDLIPPSNPMYQTKYVYIYDVNPRYVYMGYTSGYLNNYIYGGRVVYGTGFHYNPWRGAFYYPRAYTWGFGMRYNPWVGWSIGYDYGFGWLNVGFGRNYWNRGYYGGWWGPASYHPPFCWRARTAISSGFYGRANGIKRGEFLGRYNNSFNRNFTNNIYKFRKDVIISNNNIPVKRNKEFGNFSSKNNNATKNNNIKQQRTENIQKEKLLTDKEGNVYKKNNNGGWMQNNNKQWRPIANENKNLSNNLEQQQHRIERGQEHSQSFQTMRNRGETRLAPNNNIPQNGNLRDGNSKDGKGGGHKH